MRCDATNKSNLLYFRCRELAVRQFDKYWHEIYRERATDINGITQKRVQLMIVIATLVASHGFSITNLVI